MARLIPLESRRLFSERTGCAVAPHRVDERALDPDENEERDRTDDEGERADRLGRGSHDRRVGLHGACANEEPAPEGAGSFAGE